MNYNDYKEASRLTNILMTLYKRGYQEKEDLAFYYKNPLKNCPRQEVRTSGSTGTPVRFWCNKERIASSLSLIDIRFYQLGLNRGDVFMKFWYPTTGHTLLQILKEKLFRRLTKEKFFSYFDIAKGTKTIDDFINYVNKVKPDFLEGYAGGLVAISSYIIDNKIWDIHKIRTIVTGAGVVTDKQHELIERAFGCRHYDRYGCSEFGEIAHQLGRGYYEPNPHLIIEVSDDLKHFRTLDKARDGEYEIFITDPRNTCTLFRRYRMHDIVVVRDGHIVAVTGRTEKMYELSNGRFMPTGIFYQAIKDFVDIHQWQIIIKDSNITLKTTPRILGGSERKQFEKYFGSDMTFKYECGDFVTVGRREKIQEIVVL